MPVTIARVTVRIDVAHPPDKTPEEAVQEAVTEMDYKMEYDCEGTSILKTQIVELEVKSP